MVGVSLLLLALSCSGAPSAESAAFARADEAVELLDRDFDSGLAALGELHDPVAAAHAWSRIVGGRCSRLSREQGFRVCDVLGWAVTVQTCRRRFDRPHLRMVVDAEGCPGNEGR